MDYEVIVVGGGPVGMMLAGELALAGVKVCLLERLKETMPYSRALNLHPRSLELFDLRGLKTKLVSIGKLLPIGHYAALDTKLDFSLFHSASNYTLYIPQHDTRKCWKRGRKVSAWKFGGRRRWCRCARMRKAWRLLPLVRKGKPY